MAEAAKSAASEVRPGTDSLERRSFLWSALGLGMLAAIGLIAAWTLRQVNVSDYWIDHTRDVILTAESLVSDLKDAESAQRGYLITGEDFYVETYRSRVANVPADLENLKKLIADNPGQMQRLARLESVVTFRTKAMAELVRLRGEKGFEEARRSLLAADGQTRGQVRQIEEEIQAEEYRLLQERSRTRTERLRQGFMATLGASLLALGALLLAPLDVRRAVRQRNLAQKGRQESEATVRSLFDAAAQAIFIVDQNGRIRMANPATEKMFGFSQAELLGQSVDILVPEHLRGGHVTHRTRYFGHPQTRPMGLGMDLHACHKDGTTFYVEISLSHIQSAQGALAVAFVTDISKRKADEAAIRQQREELQVLTGKLLTAQDEERRRIARDLHDDLSQTLAGLAIDLGRHANKAAAGEATSHLRQLQGRATKAAESVRRISHRLHSSVLDDIGLVAALEQFCDEFQERSGIRTEFASQDVPDRLSLALASSLYNIAQECLHNVSKHSQTSVVAVHLEQVNAMLRLTVTDHGVGFRAGTTASKGIGIGTMQERARLLQGHLSIRSEPGRGTEVKVEVPLTPVQ